LAEAKEKQVHLVLPVDHVVAEKMEATSPTRTVGSDAIPAGMMGLDIGPKTCETFAQEIRSAKTIVWNGPMGVFEMAPFAHGTLAVAQAVAANTGATSIVGGGDSVSAVNDADIAGKITHISTGGGASLEFLEGKKLPGVEALSDK
jgi:phosphoglycerate kinase